MTIIDGKKISDEIKAELKTKIERTKSEGLGVPGLAAILVGDNPASRVYVNSKRKACEKIGMKSAVEFLPTNTTESELIEIVNKYNNDDNFNGILVQLPLPSGISEQNVIEAISPEKDVDGFHPVNVGKLVIGLDTFFPCTPYGIVELLKRYNIETSGKHVVVLGRSNIVGKPIANMLLQKNSSANAIVTVVHSAAKNISQFTKEADILIAAIGKPNYITADMVKEGVVVIDVGINRIEDAEKKKGYRIVGDVDFDSVSSKASYITPVPGGVGRMTIAMLMQNTYNAFIKQKEI